MADCDATITLIDPRPNLGDEMIKAEYLGLDIDGRLDALASAELEQAHGRLRTIHRQRAGRQLHVGGVVPSGWRDVEVRVLPGGRPRNGGGTMGGPAMRDARERAGMGVRDLARFLRVSPSTVTRYESGERAIPTDVADAVLTLTQSVPETPSKKSLYLGVSGTPNVQYSTSTSSQGI
jgi:DNA-binding XRE family transcriptional regulator